MWRAILVLSFIAMVVPLGLSEDGADSKTPEVKTPVVGGAGAQEAFDAGRSAFESGDWKGAEKKFKECKKIADKGSKKLLKSWIDACKGGKKLAKVEKTIDKNDYRNAYKQLQGLSAKYGETPLKPRIEELLVTVCEELFMMLATFEKKPPTPEEEAKPLMGRTQVKYVTDEKYVAEGERALEWKASVDISSGRMFDFLPLARFEPGLMIEYRNLHFEIFNPDKNVGRFTLIFDVGNLEELATADPLKARILFKHITVQKPGWNTFDIDVHKAIQTLTNCDRAEVEGVSLMMVPPARPKTIYLDNVRFER